MVKKVPIENIASALSQSSLAHAKGMRLCFVGRAGFEPATFMVHNGLIREEVDLLQGRVDKSVFMQHYFSPNMEDLRTRVLTAVDRIQHACNV